MNSNSKTRKWNICNSITYKLLGRKKGLDGMLNWLESIYAYSQYINLHDHRNESLQFLGCYPWSSILITAKILVWVILESRLHACQPQSRMAMLLHIKGFQPHSWGREVCGLWEAMGLERERERVGQWSLGSGPNLWERGGCLCVNQLPPFRFKLIPNRLPMKE